MGMSDLLVLATSPRKGGNCDDAARLLCEAVGSEASVALYDCDIKRCQGCLDCQQGKPCGIEDDFGALWERLKAASTVVLVVPVYWCAPPGLFKDFLDRTVVSFGAEPMKGKAVHLVSVAQSAGFEPHEKIIDTWVRWHGGSALKTTLRLIAFHRGELLQNGSAVKKLKQLGRTLAERNGGR